MTQRKAGEGDYVSLYDSTLRDGAQTPGLDITLNDKLLIARELDDFGIDYVEAGWPGATPMDERFFSEPPRLHHAKLTAFGMTRRRGAQARSDPLLARLVAARAPCACIVGKSWDFQVTKVLRATLEENLAMIGDSLRLLTDSGKETLFDAEHFFDGFKANADYALACLAEARKAGASWLVLCDTNGGTLPYEIESITQAAARHVAGARLGIHCHDDSGHAVANSLAAVRAGARQIQGTFNGLGERCGNANLVTLLPTLTLKMGFKTGVPRLEDLTRLSHAIDEIVNRTPESRAPYVGRQAFAHKAGLHSSAVARDPRAYEHIPPEAVGNERHIVASGQLGRGGVMLRLADCGVKVAGDEPWLDVFVAAVKAREDKGYSYDGAEAGFELLALRHQGALPVYFRVESYRVASERHATPPQETVARSEATVTLRCRGRVSVLCAEGNGPVNALDNALRRLLAPVFPELEDLHLADYKVRILSPAKDTEAVTRVIVGCRDGAGRQWSTVAVSANIIDASFKALVDAIVWKLFHGGARADDTVADGDAAAVASVT